jgi:hypothetical protein
VKIQGEVRAEVRLKAKRPNGWFMKQATPGSAGIDLPAHTVFYITSVGQLKEAVLLLKEQDEVLVEDVARGYMGANTVTAQKTAARRELDQLVAEGRAVSTLRRQNRTRVRVYRRKP